MHMCEASHVPHVHYTPAQQQYQYAYQKKKQNKHQNKNVVYLLATCTSKKIQTDFSDP